MIGSPDTPVLRFAPSPNGELHLGHAYSALLNAQMAASCGGRLLLRIEDIDTVRCTPEFEAGIYRDLEWLGSRWETPVRRQSEHFVDYDAALDRLKAAGLIYPAFMSRAEIRDHMATSLAAGKPWPRDPDGAPLYPPMDKQLGDTERRRRIESGEPFAWRLDVDRAMAETGQALSWQEMSNPVRNGQSDPDFAVQTIIADPSIWGDVVIARKETPTSYHLSVVMDDALQGVTHVVRGKDLYDATGIHRLMQELLDLPQPMYHHHRLILGPDGRKLSKSFRDTGLRELRDAGVSPAEVRRLVGMD